MFIAICGDQVEAGVMRRLGQHPHILKFHGVAREGNRGSEYLVTELASEGSLRDVLSAAEDRGERMTLAVLLMIAQQVCEGLQPQHSKP